jgi:hypothetical protein
VLNAKDWVRFSLHDHSYRYKASSTGLTVIRWTVGMGGTGTIVDQEEDNAAVPNNNDEVITTRRLPLGPFTLH